MADPVTQYARDVVRGEATAPVGRLVRLACERHLRDRDTGDDRGLKWDDAAAAHALHFFRYLRLSEGAFDGQPFRLEPWQAFIVGSLFGWKGPDGYRRFRTAYVEIGKGNGKSPLAAGIGLYAMLADGEAGAEVYSAATTREQASILFRDAKNMISASPDLKRRLAVAQAAITHAQSRSVFKPVSSEHKGLDGKRVHVALVDELHEHPTALVVDKMRAGTKGRRQALIFEITNSGHDRQSVCWQHHEYSVDVLLGKRTNDSWFAFVCGLDPCPVHQAEGKTQPVSGCGECDDWRNPDVWTKANPNLGVSVTEKYLREQVEEAEGMPSKEGLTKRLNFCWWSETETAWLPADLWARGASPAIDPASLAGLPCYGGLDLASKVALAAFVLAFPDHPDHGQTTLLAWHWMPRASAEARSIADGVPYLQWAERGLIKLTPGDVIDQDTIEQDIKDLSDIYDIKDVAFDPWNAAQITTHLSDHGIKVVEFRQSIYNFNEPTKLFEALLKDGKLCHGGNPVLDWQAGNVAVITDRSGNVRPVKPEHGSPKKVDGIVAAVMALGRSMLAGPGGSVYEERGLEVL